VEASIGSGRIKEKDEEPGGCGWFYGSLEIMPGTPSSLSYQLKMSLRGISPMIWRRLLVPADMTLHGVHRTIQIVTETDRATPGGLRNRQYRPPEVSLRIDELGLTLAEAKTLLSGLQVRITDVQIRDITQHEQLCPCCHRLRQLKDHRTITVRACLGKLKLSSPRYRRCRCEGAAGLVAPVVAALPERVTPDLLALGARVAALSAYVSTR
jgi:hypothetical protein